MLSDCNLRGSIAIFAERRILMGILFVAVVQFVDDSCSQHPFALAVDEDNLLTFLMFVFLNRPAEHIELMIQAVVSSNWSA